MSNQINLTIQVLMSLDTLKNNPFAKIYSGLWIIINQIYHPIMQESGEELNYAFDYKISNHFRIHNWLFLRSFII